MKEYIMRYENEVLQLLPDKIQPLVRCKDCEHGEQSVLPNRHLWCRIHEFYREPDWFCADGERKDGDFNG